MSFRRLVCALLGCALAACGAEVADDGSDDSGTAFGSSSSGTATGQIASGADSGYDWEPTPPGYPPATDYAPPDSEPDAGSAVNDSGTVPVGSFRSDADAPLPPAQDGGGFNAIYNVGDQTMYFPLFSSPSCAVVPPYGEFYYVVFTPPNAGPNGVFPSCFYSDGELDSAPCYTPGRASFEGERDDQNISGGRFELSAFDGAGIATGAMDTVEGLVPLAVKFCP